MLMNQRAAMYLKAFANDGEIEGGLAFATALKQSRLDYTPESLDRIDHLLKQVRTRLAPEYGSFLDAQPNQNFLYLLGFYVGALVALHSKIPIKWHPYEELVRLYDGAAQDYPLTFATSITCVLGGNALFIPLSPILEQLFDPEDGRSVRISAEKYMVDRAATMQFRNPSLQALAETPAALKSQARAMRLAGYIAAHSVWTASERGQLMPTLGSALPGGKTQLKTLAYDTLEEAVNAGHQQLAQPADDEIAAALAYDAFINLATGRPDALVVDARVHHGTPFSITLAVPYRPADGAARFAVHGVKLIASNAPEAALAPLMDHFYVGVHEHAVAARAWAAQLDESV